MAAWNVGVSVMCGGRVSWTAYTLLEEGMSKLRSVLNSPLGETGAGCAQSLCSRGSTSHELLCVRLWRKKLPERSEDVLKGEPPCGELPGGGDGREEGTERGLLGPPSAFQAEVPTAKLTWFGTDRVVGSSLGTLDHAAHTCTLLHTAKLDSTKRIEHCVIDNTSLLKC